MIQSRGFRDLFTCLLLFNPETEIDFLELMLFETINDQLDFVESLEMIYLYFMKICLILMENSYREILYHELKKRRFHDWISDLDKENLKTDIGTSHSFNSITSESSGQLKASLCPPFQPRVSFSNSLTRYDYTRDYDSSSTTLMTIELERRRSWSSHHIFGKDTTSFYRWDHTPSYQLIKDFIFEKRE